MTRYGFVVVGSSGAVGGFAGLSPKAASRNASKKPPSCVNDMRRVEGVEHHTLKAQVHRGARSTAPVSLAAAVEAFAAELQSSAAFEP